MFPENYNNILHEISDFYGCNTEEIVTLKTNAQGLTIDITEIINCNNDDSYDQLMTMLVNLAEEGRIAYLSNNDEEKILHISKAAARLFNIVNHHEYTANDPKVKSFAKGSKVRVEIIDDIVYTKMLTLLRKPSQELQHIVSSKMLLSQSKKEISKITCHPYGPTAPKHISKATSHNLITRDMQADEECYRLEHQEEKEERFHLRKLVLLQTNLMRWLNVQENQNKALKESQTKIGSIVSWVKSKLQRS